MSQDAIADTASEEVFYDPARPVLTLHARRPAMAVASCQNQRLRRSQILATIRRLLVQHGLNGVTVRRIAENSGHAVQTIYNLLGPRDQAIIEAICEYTRYVGYTAMPDPTNPDAVHEITQCWLRSIEAEPEFCRQVCLIFFTDSRDIYYAFRDRQLKAMHGLLSRQQKCGVLRADANVRELAEQLVLFASALCIDWADQPFPLEEFRRRLCSAYANLLNGAINPAGLSS